MYDSRDLTTHAVCVGMTLKLTAKPGESLETLTAERDELLKRIEEEAGELTASLDPASVALEKIRVAPRKSDIAIARVGVAWEPWRAGADGFPRPVSTL